MVPANGGKLAAGDNKEGNVIHFKLDDPLTRAKRDRSKRQKQAFFNITIGLVLGGSMTHLLMELFKGVGA